MTILRVGPALQLDDEAHARPVGLVAQVRDPLELLLTDQVGDLRDQSAVAALLDHERELGDDQRVLAAAKRLAVDPARILTLPRPEA